MPLVEFIYDGGCPNAAAARKQLLHAFSNAGVRATWTEWDGTDPDIPDHAKRHGSPTILVDGRDVSDGTTSGVPPLDRIVAALESSPSGRTPKRKNSLMATFSSVISWIIVLFPKAACPA